MVVALGSLLVLFLRRGLSAREEPSAIEAFVARRLRHLAIPTGARELQNPLSLTEEILAEGREHFADHCASCHANDGSGATEMGQGLYPKAPDMRLPETQELSDGELFYIIENGVRFTGMPAWGSPSPDDDGATWALVHFVRHLPSITAGEFEAMKDLNPKSRQEWEEEREILEFLEGGEQPIHKH
jgi:mono/diheme cytochrome c family protein